MKKNKVLLFIMLFFCISIMATIHAGYAIAGTPHLAIGSITNSDASIPSTNDIQFSAYISTRTDDVLTQSSHGCSYDGTTYGVEVGNFTQPWAADEVLVIKFVNLTKLEAKTIEVTLTNAGLDTTNVQLATIAPATLTITPVNPTVQAPNTQQFTAVATFAEVSGDQDVTNKVTWSSSDTDKGTINAAGLFTTIHAGSTDITASLSSVTSNTSTVTVTAGALATLTVSPDAPTLTADQAQQFTVTGVDANGNAANNGTITWSVTGDIGTINSTGLFTATTVDSGTVTATSSIGSVADTSGTITVTAGVLATLTVSPNTPTLTADDTQQFTAAGVDADGNAASSGTITWSITGDIGTINSTGLFTATTVGTGTVTATSDIGSVADTSGTITVTAGAANKMTLAASKTTIASDAKGSATLTATILDENGNVITTDNSTVVTFTLTDSTYLSLSSPTATAVNGVALMTVTSKSDLVTTPPATAGVNITSSPELTPPTATPDITLTIVNFSIDVTTPSTPFVDGTGIHLLTGGTPSTATFSGTGSTTGDYRWTLSGVGGINSTTTDSITYTAPVSITGDSQTATLTLTSATDDNLSDTINILIYNPLAITWPTSAVCIVIGDTTKDVTVTGGTGTYKFQSSNTDVAAIDADGGGITPAAVGTCNIKVRDVIYGDFTTENGFFAESPAIEIVNPIVIGSKPVNDAMESGAENTFTATGGKTDGEVDWSVTAGTIDADGKFTAPAVTTAEKSIDIIITAWDKTYNESHNTPIKTEYTVTIYASMYIIQTPTGYIDGTPSTYPLLKFGETTTLTVADDTRTYDWAVKDWDGAQIGDTVTAATIDVNPDALFEANGAGIYTVILTDNANTETTPTTLNVRVPMKFVATKFTADAGNYKTDTDTDDTYTVYGCPAVGVYNFSAFDLNGIEVVATDIGEFENASPTAADNIFTFASIDSMQSYRVKVTLNSTSVDADVLRLVTAGLDTVWSGTFRVIPVVAYSGTVVDLSGSPVVDAIVACTNGDVDKMDFTNDNGVFTITGFYNTGVTYKFAIMHDDYIDKIVTSDEIEAGDIVLEELAEGSGMIDGTVTLIDDLDYEVGGLVSIQVKTAAGDYIKDGEGNIITSLANPLDGSYSFPVPANDADAGPYTVEFKKTGYIFDEDAELGMLTEVALDEELADITLYPVTIISVTGTPEDADSDDIMDQVLVKITAEAGLIPTQFDGTTTEIKVEDATGSAVTLDTYESAGDYTWSFTHDAYENFTITVYADVSDDRDVDNNYKAAKSWTYVKSATPPTTCDIDPMEPEPVSSDSGDTNVDLPPGGLTGDILNNVTIAIVEADADDAGAEQITGSEIVEVVMTDDSGDNVPNEDIQRIEITIKFDTSVVTEGSLEAGTYVIYQADSLTELVEGNATAIPPTQLILPVDYENGFVTFWVNHLSAFGIGAASADDTSSGSHHSSSSNCFIGTAAYDSLPGGHAKTLAPVLFFMFIMEIGAAFFYIRRKQQSDMA